MGIEVRLPNTTGEGTQNRHALLETPTCMPQYMRDIYGGELGKPVTWKDIIFPRLALLLLSLQLAWVGAQSDQGQRLQVSL